MRLNEKVLVEELMKLDEYFGTRELTIIEAAGICDAFALAVLRKGGLDKFADERLALMEKQMSEGFSSEHT